ncbi:unnamed protein product [Symbiodinium sp. CCMP2592]|nr:unnamed protein product [Symbiodinium sp. CCMP2592]
MLQETRIALLLNRSPNHCHAADEARLPALPAPTIRPGEAPASIFVNWAPLQLALGYVVELRPAGTKAEWAAVDVTGNLGTEQGHFAPSCSSCKVAGLRPGYAYEARVTYVSSCGCRSEASDASQPCAPCEQRIGRSSAGYPVQDVAWPEAPPSHGPMMPAPGHHAHAAGPAPMWHGIHGGVPPPPPPRSAPEISAPDEARQTYISSGGWRSEASDASQPFAPREQWIGRSSAGYPVQDVAWPEASPSHGPMMPAPGHHAHAAGPAPMWHGIHGGVPPPPPPRSAPEISAPDEARQTYISSGGWRSEASDASQPFAPREQRIGRSSAGYPVQDVAWPEAPPSHGPMMPAPGHHAHAAGPAPMWHGIHGGVPPPPAAPEIWALDEGGFSIAVRWSSVGAMAYVVELREADGIMSLSTVEGWLFHSREIREKCVVHSSGSAGGAESEKLSQAAP